MSKQTEALKLALEVLENMLNQYYADTTTRNDLEMADNAITAIREALEQPAQQQEPVAVVKALPMGQNQTDMHYAECQHLPVGTLLYTSPPASKPLTDEEIWDEVKAADLDWQTGWSLDEDASNRYITFARAIEAAHGIKENK